MIDLDLGLTAALLAADGLAVDDLAVLDARHVDRPVLQGRIGERPVVVKCHTDRTTADAGHRAAVAMWQGTTGPGRAGVVPEPIGWSPTAVAVVSERAPGTALGARGDLGGALERADDVATLLARLHTVDVDRPLSRGIERRDPAGVVRSTRRKAAELPTHVAGRAAAVADTLAGALAGTDGALVVTHGDFTPRNLLVAPSRELRLIDLDRVRRAPAGRDLGYWRAWCWATQLMAGTGPRWSDTDPFVSAYLDRRGGDPTSVVASLHLHVAAGLVRIAHGWSALAALPELQETIVAEAERVLAPARDAGACAR